MNINSFVNKRTKEKVIDVVLNSPPINIRQVWSRLGQEKLTYHAVYKTMKILEKEGVIKKSSGGYEVSKEWINSLKSIARTFEKIKSQPGAESILQEIEKNSLAGESYYLKFKNRMEMERFLLKSMTDFEGDILSISDHFWYYLVYPRELKEMIAKRGKEITILANYETDIDKEGQKFYKKIGLQTRIGARTGIPDLLVLGEYIFYIYVKDDKLSRIFGEEGKGLEISELYKMLEESMECHVVIIKSKQITEIMKKRAEELIKQEIKYISFSFGGTLVDSSFDEIIWRYEIPRMYAHKNGMKYEDAYEYVTSEYRKFYGRATNWRSIDFWVKHFKLNKTPEEILNKYKDKIKAFEETPEVLQKLSKKYSLVLLTLSDKNFLKKRMEVLKLDKYFHKIILISLEYKQDTKTEETYQKMLKDLKINPGQIVHVGKDYELDYLTPTKVGIKAFLVDRNYEKTGAHIIHNLIELEDKIK